MSSQKFPRKKYDTPLHPWKESRIKTERELIKKYGLKNHTEVWKAKTYLGKHRQQARELLAKVGTATPQIKKESDQLLLHLTRMGILSMGATLDDVLALEIESVLSRRLQTIVYLKGFSSTPYQARQLISHGHVAVRSRKVTVPSYMVAKDEESKIHYTVQSPLNEISHPARPKGDMYKTIEAGTPLKPPVEETPATTAVVPSKEEPAAALTTPVSQPAPVVEVPVPPTEPSAAPLVETHKEETPVKQEDKPKDQPKKEKKKEGEV
ncbi:MAG: 30S ribosomal protein S4 [Candidatus Thermoplasmatota archaeon]|nr:30S ribosomal protein S4 [Candidatus Thermoplasmatota archaeon]